MRSPNFIMQRIFMPVGQGAFYIEKFNDGFTVVYDCGSYKNTSIVEKNIKNSILDTKKIDLLVISHYHEDHINGLEYLFKNFDVKRMLMPYLNLTEKIESFIDADIKNNSNEFNKIFCIDPNKALKDNFGKSTEITFVHPEESSQSNEVDIQTLSQSINSGDKITCNVTNYTWSYIPFNFQDTKRTEQFKKLTEHLDLDSVDKFRDYYEKNKKELIDIYEKVEGDKNTNSLVLYSGVYSRANSPSIKTTTYSRRKSFSFTQNISGCLYLGDYDAKGSRKMKVVEEKYKSFYTEISTIQIPHHGSRCNYNPRLNFKPNIISVISAGINNKFEHPHSETLKQITIQNGIVILVTEEEETKLTQSIYLRETYR